MSQNAFDQITRDMNEAAGMREHAKMVRAEALLQERTEKIGVVIAELLIDRALLRRALAQIAAGTVPHREGNTTAEDYSEFAADVLEAKA